MIDQVYYAAIKAAWQTRQKLKHRRALRNRADVDSFLVHIGEEFKVSSERGYQAMNSAYFAAPARFHQGDPFSESYRQRQFELYKLISGRDHYAAFENEETALDIEMALVNPYPYQSKNPRVIGNHLLSHAFLLAEGNIPPSSRILEIGAGWGLTTMHFAKSGFDVTVVDVSKNFCDYLRRLAAKEGVKIEVICSDMLSFKPTQPFDAVCFNESFHHCFDHAAMVRQLSDWISPTGQILFNAEPIQWQYPYPWGLRLDGQSIWAIRSFGWFELGFNTRYFKEILHRHGWRCERRGLRGAEMAYFFTAQRSKI